MEEKDGKKSADEASRAGVWEVFGFFPPLQTLILGYFCFQGQFILAVSDSSIDLLRVSELICYDLSGFFLFFFSNDIGIC